MRIICGTYLYLVDKSYRYRIKLQTTLLIIPKYITYILWIILTGSPSPKKAVSTTNKICFFDSQSTNSQHYLSSPINYSYGMFNLRDLKCDERRPSMQYKSSQLTNLNNKNKHRVDFSHHATRWGPSSANSESERACYRLPSNQGAVFPWIPSPMGFHRRLTFLFFAKNLVGKFQRAIV